MVFQAHIIILIHYLNSCLNVLGKPASHIYLELTKNFKNTGQIDFVVDDVSDYTIHLDLLRDLNFQRKVSLPTEVL